MENIINQFYLIITENDFENSISNIENIKIIKDDLKNSIKQIQNNSVVFVTLECYKKLKEELQIIFSEKITNFVIIAENNNIPTEYSDFTFDNICFIFKNNYNITDLLRLVINFFLENPNCFNVIQSIFKIEDFEENILFLKTSKCTKSNQNVSISEFSEKLSKSIKNLKIRGLLKYFIFEQSGCIFSGKIEELSCSKSNINAYVTEMLKILDIYENKNRIKMLDQKSAVLSDTVYEIINITFAYLLRDDYICAVLSVLSKRFNSQITFTFLKNSITFNNGLFIENAVECLNETGINNQELELSFNNVLFGKLNIYYGNSFDENVLNEFFYLVKNHLTLGLLFFDLIEKEKIVEKKVFQQEKMASMGQLYLGVIHEINNPNTIVYGNTELINYTASDLLNIVDDIKDDGIKNIFIKGLKEILESSHAVSVASERISQIVKNMKMFSKYDFTTISKINIHKVISEAVNIVKSNITKSDEINVFFEVDEIPELRGNFDEILQIIINLLTNATQSFEQKRKEIDSEFRGEIKIFINSDNKNVKIRILDDGIGCEEIYFSKILEPFFTTKMTGGTGLGLNIVYNIITKYGGEIKLDSVKNEFFEIEIILPL